MRNVRTPEIWDWGGAGSRTEPPTAWGVVALACGPRVTVESEIEHRVVLIRHLAPSHGT